MLRILVVEDSEWRIEQFRKWMPDVVRLLEQQQGRFDQQLVASKAMRQQVEAIAAAEIAAGEERTKTAEAQAMDAHAKRLAAARTTRAASEDEARRLLQGQIGSLRTGPNGALGFLRTENGVAMSGLGLTMLGFSLALWLTVLEGSRALVVGGLMAAALLTLSYLLDTRTDMAKLDVLDTHEEQMRAAGQAFEAAAAASLAEANLAIGRAREALDLIKSNQQTARTKAEASWTEADAAAQAELEAMLNRVQAIVVAWLSFLDTLIDRLVAQRNRALDSQALLLRPIGEKPHDPSVAPPSVIRLGWLQPGGGGFKRPSPATASRRSSAAKDK